VTSINGLGVDVNEWPTSEESVSSMTLNLLSAVDPLVRSHGALHCVRSRGADVCCARVAARRRRCATTVRRRSALSLPGMRITR